MLVVPIPKMKIRGARVVQSFLFYATNIKRKTSCVSGSNQGSFLPMSDQNRNASPNYHKALTAMTLVPIERECTQSTWKSHSGTLRTLWPCLKWINGLDETVIETSVANKSHRFSLDWNKRSRLTVDRILELKIRLKLFDRFFKFILLFLLIMDHHSVITCEGNDRRWSILVKKWRTAKSIVLKINKTPSKLNQPKGSHARTHEPANKSRKSKKIQKFIAGSRFFLLFFF